MTDQVSRVKKYKLILDQISSIFELGTTANYESLPSLVEQMKFKVQMMSSELTFKNENIENSEVYKDNKGADGVEQNVKKQDIDLQNDERIMNFLARQTTIEDDEDGQIINAGPRGSGTADSEHQIQQINITVSDKDVNAGRSSGKRRSRDDSMAFRKKGTLQFENSKLQNIPLSDMNTSTSSTNRPRRRNTMGSQIPNLQRRSPSKSSNFNTKKITHSAIVANLMRKYNISTVPEELVEAIIQAHVSQTQEEAQKTGQSLQNVGDEVQKNQEQSDRTRANRQLSFSNLDCEVEERSSKVISSDKKQPMNLSDIANHKIEEDTRAEQVFGTQVGKIVKLFQEKIQCIEVQPWKEILREVEDNSMLQDSPDRKDQMIENPFGNSDNTNSFVQSGTMSPTKKSSMMGMGSGFGEPLKPVERTMVISEVTPNPPAIITGMGISIDEMLSSSNCLMEENVRMANALDQHLDLIYMEDDESTIEEGEVIDIGGIKLGEQLGELESNIQRLMQQRALN